MRPERKALLSVFSAIGVAISEAILYWIWQWRLEKALHSKKFKNAKTKKKEDFDSEPQAAEPSVGTDLVEDKGIRKRGAANKRAETD